MTIEFQNSVVRSSFLCHITDIKIALINPCKFKPPYIKIIKYDNFRKIKALCSFPTLP